MSGIAADCGFHRNFPFHFGCYKPKLIVVHDLVFALIFQQNEHALVVEASFAKVNQLVYAKGTCCFHKARYLTYASW